MPKLGNSVHPNGHFPGRLGGCWNRHWRSAQCISKPCHQPEERWNFRSLSGMCHLGIVGRWKIKARAGSWRVGSTMTSNMSCRLLCTGELGDNWGRWWHLHTCFLMRFSRFCSINNPTEWLSFPLWGWETEAETMKCSERIWPAQKGSHPDPHSTQKCYVKARGWE